MDVFILEVREHKFIRFKNWNIFCDKIVASTE